MINGPGRCPNLVLLALEIFSRLKPDMLYSRHGEV